MNLIQVQYKVNSIKGRYKINAFVNPAEIVSIEMDEKNDNVSWIYLKDGRQLQIDGHYTSLRNLALGKNGMPFKQFS